MRSDERSSATTKSPERPRKDKTLERADEHKQKAGIEDFKSKVDLPGKTDSGPEPDVFGQEIPPQD